MQIVGLNHENGYKYIHSNNFEGVTVFENKDVEVNVAQHPVQGYTELNINSLTRDNIDLWADWIQSGTKYMLNIMIFKKLSKSGGFHIQGSFIVNLGKFIANKIWWRIKTSDKLLLA